MFRLIPVTFILLLSACGFTPLYAPAPTSAALASVQLETIAEREGQQLRLLLSDRFYATRPPAPARYKLSVTLSSTREDLGVRSDDIATRARRGVYATFALTPVGGTAPVLSGTERSFAGYNIYNDPYATDAAEVNALERSLTQVADQLTNRVALYLAANPPSSSEAIGRESNPSSSEAIGQNKP
jgi:LPS-assembly lipoprotein